MMMDTDKVPALDREALDMNTMADEQLQRELFEIFFDQAPSLYDRFFTALRTDDTQEWCSAAHAFKGSARALGLVRVAALAQMAEDGVMGKELLRLFAQALDDARGAAAPFLRVAA